MTHIALIGCEKNVDRRPWDACDHLDAIIEKVHKATGLPCIKGTAPQGDVP